MRIAGPRLDLAAEDVADAGRWLDAVQLGQAAREPLSMTTARRPSRASARPRLIATTAEPVSDSASTMAMLWRTSSGSPNTIRAASTR